jgi:hypothetical protein
MPGWFVFSARWNPTEGSSAVQRHHVPAGAFITVILIGRMTVSDPQQAQEQQTGR